MTPEQRHLIDRLTALPLRDAGPSAWMRAAQILGAAHDLLATHLDANHLPRTPEIQDLVTPTAVLAPAHSISALLLDAVNAGTHLVDTTIEAQRTLSPRPVSYSQLKALRHWTARVRPYVKAAHLDLSALAGDHSSAISNLEPAPALQLGQPEGSVFDSTLDALRVLRQLTFAQANGTIAASPMSLRDLATLGAAASRPNVSWLPEAQTNLDRLKRAAGPRRPGDITPGLEPSHRRLDRVDPRSDPCSSRVRRGDRQDREITRTSPPGRASSAFLCSPDSEGTRPTRSATWPPAMHWSRSGGSRTPVDRLAPTRPCRSRRAGKPLPHSGHDLRGSSHDPPRHPHPAGPHSAQNPRSLGVKSPEVV